LPTINKSCHLSKRIADITSAHIALAPNAPIEIEKGERMKKINLINITGAHGQDPRQEDRVKKVNTLCTISIRKIKDTMSPIEIAKKASTTTVVWIKTMTIVQVSTMTAILASGIISKKEIVRKFRMPQTRWNMADMRITITIKIEIDWFLTTKGREEETVLKDKENVEEVAPPRVDQRARNYPLEMISNLSSPKKVHPKSTKIKIQSL
jgi:hypothetical protein